MFKKIVRSLMERKVKKYFAKHKPLLVVVTGSVGKTSTKIAVATVLAEKFRVRTQDGNHNTDVSVPPALLGVQFPEEVHSVRAWWRVLKAMNLRIREEKDVDVIVQELGTSNPGEVPYFGTYLQPDVAVVTAVSEEHMEFFPSLEAIAEEELSVASYAKLTVINTDDIDAKFAPYAHTTNINTYGISISAEYRLQVQPADPLEGRMGKLYAPEWGELPVSLQLIGDHSLKAAAAAACVAAKLGLSADQIAIGISKIRPTKGRMNVLRGQNGSWIIDDSYNSSPLAVKAALDLLYQVDTPQRIAVLGSMNEMGAHSQAAHEAAGSLCDPNKLEWMVTIGQEANAHLAPAAEKRGCRVKSFTTPYQAAAFVHDVLQDGAVVLVKGSQNGVYAEETVKALLHSAEDQAQLVRQNEYWMKQKENDFSPFKEEIEE